MKKPAAPAGGWRHTTEGGCGKCDHIPSLQRVWQTSSKPRLYLCVLQLLAYHGPGWEELIPCAFWPRFASWCLAFPSP